MKASQFSEFLSHKCFYLLKDGIFYRPTRNSRFGIESAYLAFPVSVNLAVGELFATGLWFDKSTMFIKLQSLAGGLYSFKL